MKRSKTFFIAFLFIPLVFIAKSQSPVDDITKQKLKQIIDYHYFLLNTLGDPKSPDNEKEIIINQTYLKSFTNSKVQIEDDLDTTRSVITNKDVQAYLKDVEFFFQNATFKYRIEKISVISKNEHLIYKIEVERYLKATTINGDGIDNKIDRFFEINKQLDTGELKIASIYTQKISIDEEYSYWWQNLSEVWKSVIRKKCGFFENPKKEDFEKIASIDSLDISNAYLVENLQPLLKLYQLVYLDISNTSLVDVIDLMYCSKLKHLRAKNTNVNSFNVLKLSNSITHLDISNNILNDFNFLLGLNNLEYLDLSNSNIIQSNPYIEVINKCDKLKTLKLNGVNLRHIGRQIPELDALEVLSVKDNHLKDLEGLDAFIHLKEIDFSGNMIVSTKEIYKNINLEVIKANNTYVNDFQGVEDLVNLKTVVFNVDFDNKAIVEALLKMKPKLKVFYNSAYLRKWWASLTNKQEAFFMENYKISQKPNIENLVKVTYIKKLNLSNLKWVNDLKFIEPLIHLSDIDISHTSVEDFTILKSFSNLSSLKISGLSIDNFDDLLSLKNLSTIDISQGVIKSTDVLNIPKAVTKINIDETNIKKEIKDETILKYPKILWIYDSKKLNKWWLNLKPTWHNLFTNTIYSSDTKKKLSGDDLHRVRLIETLVINDKNVTNITPCSKLIHLKSLDISALKINTLVPIVNLKNIENLNISQNPISSLKPISKYENLKSLNIANTAITALDDIKAIFSLEKIDLSGTSIKDLKQLQLLANLVEIYLSNTPIKSLKGVMYLPNIKRVVCYNSKVKQKSLDQFKERNFNAKVIYE